MKYKALKTTEDASMTQIFPCDVILFNATTDLYENTSSYNNSHIAEQYQLNHTTPKLVLQSLDAKPLSRVYETFNKETSVINKIKLIY